MQTLTDDPGSRPLQGDSAYERLRDEIRSGALRPGARCEVTVGAGRTGRARRCRGLKARLRSGRAGGPPEKRLDNEQMGIYS